MWLGAGWGFGLAWPQSGADRLGLGEGGDGDPQQQPADSGQASRAAKALREKHGAGLRARLEGPSERLCCLRQVAKPL